MSVDTGADGVTPSDVTRVGDADTHTEVPWSYTLSMVRTRPPSICPLSYLLSPKGPSGTLYRSGTFLGRPEEGRKPRQTPVKKVNE